jgi:hypothetical protein
MTNGVIIPEAPEELEGPAPRTPGQDFGWTGPVFPVVPVHVGHKADSDSYARSRNKTYKRKIEAQKRRTK